MTKLDVPDLRLPNGVTINSSTLEGFLWAGREAGVRWLEGLPDVLAAWCDRWEITLDRELPTHSMNLVLFGTSARFGPIVIKTSPPHEEITAEIDALRVHESPQIVDVIDADPDVSIMLLRRILPGTTLRSEVESGRLNERDAAGIATELMLQYWVEPPSNAKFLDLPRWFQSLYAYYEAFPNGGGRLPHYHVELAMYHGDTLLASQAERVTLHGDLHHDNILLDKERGWTIIDPKGLIGERGYDIGTWMLNPPGVDRRKDLVRLTNDRLDWFSDLLEIERHRLWQWAMAHAVLSDCWNLEGTGTRDAYLHANAIAEVLSTMPEANRS